MGATDRTFLFLSTADTDLLTLSYAVAELPPDFPAVRAVNPATLGTPETADAFLDRELARAGVVVARLLGGRRAFDAGWEALVRGTKDKGIRLGAPRPRNDREGPPAGREPRRRRPPPGLPGGLHRPSRFGRVRLRLPRPR